MNDCGHPSERLEPGSSTPGAALTLVVKPALATLCRNKSLQLQLFARQGDVETQITTNITWRSSNTSVAVIGAYSGNATAVGSGITTISAEWADQFAYAQLEGFADEDCCADRTVALAVLIDNSKSMASVFGAGYATRLSFAKEIASAFVDSIDETKDKFGVIKFGSEPTQVYAIGQSVASAQAAIAVIPSTADETNIENAIEFASSKLDLAGADTRVIVLFSDGEDSESDAVVAATAFKDSGGVIIAVGTRAAGTGYVRLNQIASGGFFISAYPAIADGVQVLLNGLKGYLCAGQCAPEGGVYASRAQEQYSAFANWNVTSGSVDLVGKGSDGFTGFDFLPGNGLYVDMAGGQLTSKTTFNLSAEDYKLSLYVAGNQRQETRSTSVRVQVGTELDEVTEPAWNSNFTLVEYEFTPAAPTTGQIILTHGDNGVGNAAYGSLVDRVKLENLTTGAVLLFDTFDNNNLQWVPPRCVEYAGHYDGGYVCNADGCLDTPLAAQKADPHALPDTESETETEQWVSTKSYTATCPSGSTGSVVTKTATATSSISQLDADNKALAEAKAAAEAALVCTYTFAVGDIINIAFVESAVSPGKAGFAAIGGDSTDFWNQVRNAVSGATSGVLKDSDEQLVGVTITTATHEIENIPFHPDVMMQRGHRDADNDYFIYGLPAGTYDIYLYGHGADDADNTDFTVRVGASVYGPESTVNGAGWETDTWVEGNQFVKLTITVGAGETVEIEFGAGASGSHFINGLQIKRLT